MLNAMYSAAAQDGFLAAFLGDDDFAVRYAASMVARDNKRLSDEEPDLLEV